ncbi:twin-arginine translocase subunit TatC [Zafaria sp. Z1313]|uniref:twin-arginine translocase subunit TatC n=1 Tax=unclassified Zafaria TaxID=2828765 RepID=UPI002E774D7D|nr:twin-arginine translocase subunit TatC [Zafaria sp. J156]MEE1621203.1 twin-arginine translocase subunit TatC [Zafaria sp. J156]
MALKEHLIELRNRLFVSLIALFLATVGGFFLYYPVMGLLMDPLIEAGGQANFDTAMSTFDIMIKVSLFLGLVMAAPVWLYELWAFVVPGLKKKEKRTALAFIGASLPLFLGGIYLGYWVLPHALRFFIGLTPFEAVNLITAPVYLSFVLRLMLAFGLSMIVPVLMVGLNLVGVLPGRLIVKNWRITVFLICLVAAMAAPGGDAMTMFVLAGPLLVLFAAATVICLVNDKRRAKRAAALEAENAAGAGRASDLGTSA